MNPNNSSASGQQAGSPATAAGTPSPTNTTTVTTASYLEEL